MFRCVLLINIFFFYYGVVLVWFIEYMDVIYVYICLIMLGNYKYECVQNLKIKNDFIILSKKVCFNVFIIYFGLYFCFRKKKNVNFKNGYGLCVFYDFNLFLRLLI